MNQAEATALVNNLFESLGPLMMRLAFRATKSTETAEDLIQEVFLALYRDLRNHKQIENPRAWVLGALRNQIRKLARTSRLHPEDTVAPEKFDSIAAASWDNVEHDHELAPEIFSALTPREQEVVLLRLQSLKYREIGARLGISSKSVCTLLARGLKKLQVSAKADSIGIKQPKFESHEVPHALR